MKDHDVVSFADLKELASAKGPCVTVAASIPEPAQIGARLKNALRSVEGQVEDHSLIEPIEVLAADTFTDQVWANTLLIFRSPDVFSYYWLRGNHRDMALVAPWFQVRPLLARLAADQKFYLLALSRSRVRLRMCTPHASREVDLQGLVPTNLDEWLHNRQPDHVLDNRSTAGPSTGSMKGVMFGTSTDREREDEYLRHFWKEVDRGVGLVLKGEKDPLVLAGVQNEIAMYRQVSVHPHLLEESVHGAPDGLPEAELEERAWRAVERSASGPFRKAMQDAVHHRERGTIATDLKQVVKAAFEGRVADLFLAENAHRGGSWDEEAFEARVGEGNDDLLNMAAVETIKHGGRAFEVPADAMPVQKDVAAVLRF